MTSYADTLEAMKNAPYETVVIIGTGVVDNGWEALTFAMEKIAGNTLTVGPIHPIAYTIFSLRVLANGGKKDRKEYKEKQETLDRIRNSIRETFLEFKKEKKLKLRITPRTDYVQKLQRGRTLVITTNWDALLEDYYFNSNRFSVLSIHGNVADHGGIYLPTEMSIEPYREQSSSYTHLIQAHGIAIRALETAKRIVIWGNSLDFTDAELCVLLGETHHFGKTKNREYIVVDPNKEPFERLKFITGSENIRHIDPRSRWERLSDRIAGASARSIFTFIVTLF